MISKSTLVEMFNSKAYQFSQTLSDVDFCFDGVNADKTKYTPRSDKSYINWQMILGDDNRPYLKGSDGKFNRSIYQASVFAPKLSGTFPVLDSLDICELIEAEFPLDQQITRNDLMAKVENVTTSQKLEDDNYVYHVVSVTFTVVV